jgi:hypothetical protein
MYEKKKHLSAGALDRTRQTGVASTVKIHVKSSNRKNWVFGDQIRH